MKPPKEKPLTPTMEELLKWLEQQDQDLERFPGGFWTVAPWGKRTWGTSTVEALVKRGHLIYVEWKTGRGNPFPIRARLVKTTVAYHGSVLREMIPAKSPMGSFEWRESADPEELFKESFKNEEPE